MFFGLDFAYCERLFWKAWNAQGAIQVGSIKNGGIAYVTKYISSQEFGDVAFFKYDYHHLTRPSSSHSLHFGDGLYEEQKDFIKKTGCYSWHNKTRPAPTYIKNKYNVIADLDPDKIKHNFDIKCKNIKQMYEVDIHSFRDLHKFSIQQANIKQRNAAIRLQQRGKPFDDSHLNQDLYNFRHRLQDTFDSHIFSIVNPDGTKRLKFNSSLRSKLKLFQEYQNCIKQYGIKRADSMFGFDEIPF